MIKNWGAATALVALIALTSFAVLLDLSTPYHHCQGPNYCDYASKNGVKSPDYIAPFRVFSEVLFRETVNVVSTAVIAAFTIVLALRTGGLFKETAGLRDTANKQREDMIRSIAEATRAATAMEDVATHMEETARATREAARAAQDQVAIIRTSTVTTERAYVFCERIEAIWTVKYGTEEVTKWAFTPIWRNSGKTPTQYGVSCVNKWHAVNAGDLPIDFTYPNYGPKQRISIGPNAITHASPFELAPEDLQLIRDNKARLYVWGWIEYNDIFDGTERHRSEFCFEVVVTANPIYTAGGFRYRTHGPFNGIDDECRYRPQR